MIFQPLFKDPKHILVIIHIQDSKYSLNYVLYYDVA